MAEKQYIEREAIIKKLNEFGGCDTSDEWEEGFDDAISTAVKIAEDLPAADVAPVKYARNLAAQFDETICTNCGVHLGEVLRIVREDNGDDAVYYYQPKYCANCGAKFDGDVSNVGNN